MKRQKGDCVTCPGGDCECECATCTKAKERYPAGSSSPLAAAMRTVATMPRPTELTAVVALRVTPHDEAMQKKLDRVAREIERQVLRAFDALKVDSVDAYEVSVRIRL